MHLPGPRRFSLGQEGDVISYQRDGLIILRQHPPLSQQCCLSQPPPLLSHCLPHVHVGMGRGGKKGVGDICQLSSLIEELMRFTTWLLAGEPIPALTKGGPCLLFLSVEPRRL